MNVYDISQELLSCKVYPGDPIPSVTDLCSIGNGDLYNLSSLTLCVHNGTHIDAPAHFIKDGKTVEQLSLNAMVGECCVFEHQGVMTVQQAQNFVDRARSLSKESAVRILFKGDSVISADAARVFAESGVLLLGVESQSVGPIDAPMKVHLILLEKEVVLLEGLCLDTVCKEGKYLLSAAPLNIAGIEGSPCRAVLIDCFE